MYMKRNASYVTANAFQWNMLSLKRSGEDVIHLSTLRIWTRLMVAGQFKASEVERDLQLHFSIRCSNVLSVLHT